MKITNYNDFLLEKEFQRLLEAIRLINESTYNVGDTVEWDLTKGKGTPDEPSPEVEWTIPQKSKLQKAKERISDFTSWLKEDDPDIDVKFEHPVVKMLKEFIDKVKDPERIKQYFKRMLDEIKALPEKIKRDLLGKALILLAAYIPLSNLVTPDVVEKEPITAEIKADIESNQQQKPARFTPVKKTTGKTSAEFEKAHDVVMAVEAGYSGDRKDNGNYTTAKGERIFVGTNHGIAAPTLIVSDVLPRGNTNKEFKTSPEKIKELFTMSYGERYDKLCGSDEKTFAEQWKLDQKHITDAEDIEYKWNQIMKHLSKETALDIYQKDYWKPQGLDKFKSQSIANVLYDGCVNQGAGATLTVLKNSMENLGHKADGIDSWDDFHDKLTPTVNDMDSKETEELFEEIKDERMVKYRKADTWDDHGRGWTDRIDKLTYVDGQSDLEIT